MGLIANAYTIVSQDTHLKRYAVNDFWPFFTEEVQETR
jgi:hypothetical protein